LKFTRWGILSGLRLNEAKYHAGRIPIPNLSLSKQGKLVDYIKWVKGLSDQMEGATFDQKISFLMEKTKIKELRNENSAVSSACERLLKIGETPEAFILKKALETDVDTVSFDVQKVTLMTIHAAKGLEFKAVFIIGGEDGLIPHRLSEESSCDLEEERRLFYVAMTRAKEHLFITWARSRSIYGKESDRRISPFISAIRGEILDRREPVKSKNRLHVQSQMKLF
jgi:DNA helicase II / ATP-dependent DNA helicase PcrA